MNISMAEAFIGALSAHDGNLKALIDAETERTVTFGELNVLYKKISSSLVKMGCSEKEIICFFAPNCIEYVLMFVACITAGLTISPANFAYTSYELKHQLKDCSASYVFTTSELLPTVRSSLNPNIKQIFISDDKNIPGCTSLHKMFTDDGSAFRGNNLHVNPNEDIAIIPYSSGTTGLPKGVEITHKNMTSILQALSQPQYAPDYEPENANKLAFLPYFHAYGLQGTLVAGLFQGATQIIFKRFIPDLFLDCIEKYRPHTLSLVPPIVNFLISYPRAKTIDFSSVKTVGSGAAPLTKETEREFLNILKLPNLIQGYGLTETTVAVSYATLKFYKRGSSGLLIPNTHVKIVNPENQRVQGVKEAGEIWVKGPQVMKGYHKKPEATRNTLTKDGWLKTGDIGYFDEEGYIFVIDRIKELIKYKGFQIAPAELESVILNHPKVLDVGVIGIPDDRAGEVPKAYVVKKDPSLKREEINDYVKERLTSYKQLRGGISFVDEIPKSQSGKILRRKLRERAINESKSTKSKL
ncbi:DgyrCDS10674 [Dimorphilus gyrociliatus]|nr:DgyrCDS10674 [Dimorphilus gyrociliatus]